MISHVLAFTDGANMPHHEFKHAGAAAIVQMAMDQGTFVYEWGRYLGSQSNNVAELSAIELAVTLANTHALGVPLTVVTDSQYCRGVLTFSPQTEKWLYRAKRNRVLVERIRNALPEFGLFTIKWVKGHSGHRLNERADRVAKFSKERHQDWFATYWERAGFPPLTI